MRTDPLTPKERVLLLDPNCPRDLLRHRIRELEAEVKRLTLHPTHRAGWLKAEDEIVRHGYENGYRLDTIKAELAIKGLKARSLSAISGRAAELGLASLSKARVWTPEEDEILRREYEAGTKVAEIRRRLLAEGFRRNFGAIQMRAIHLGVSGNRMCPWTDRELAIAMPGLRSGRLFRDIEADLRAAGFERSEGALTKLARRSGLSRPAERWTDEQIEDLRRIYPTGRPAVSIADELGKSPKAVASKASELGLRQRRPRRCNERAAA